MTDNNIDPIFQIVDDAGSYPCQVCGNFILFLLIFGIKNGCSTPAHSIPLPFFHYNGQYKFIDLHFPVTHPFRLLFSAGILGGGPLLIGGLPANGRTQRGDISALQNRDPFYSLY